MSSRQIVITVGMFFAAIYGSVFTNTCAYADSLKEALVQAYQSNPQINAQRAAVRVTDENVPQALSGYRPRVTANASAGEQSVSTLQSLSVPAGAPAQYLTQSGQNFPHSVGLTITQNLFNGFQTANRTRQAESQILAARATLHYTEQSVLLNAVTAYMNLLRDTAIYELQKRNVEVLQKQVKQTQDRYKVGDVTTTDVSQSASRLAAGESQVLTAESNLKTSKATYRAIIGSEPGKLSPGTPVDRFAPKSLNDAIAVATSSNPTVVSAQHALDAAILQVKVAEGALLPTLALQAGYQRNWESQLSLLDSYNASILTQLSVPLYQGGAEYSLVRQAKEQAGQRRLELDLAARQARQGVVQAWGQVESTIGSIRSTETQVKTAESALNGVRDEANVGQRTTLDVLNAQQELVNARAALVTAQRDRVVASYTLLAATGRLAPEILELNIRPYNPKVHYHQVRDSWTGLRTPDGK